MKKSNTFYVLLAVVLVIVFLKTSCMGDAKQQDDPTLKTKAVLENIAARKSVRKYLKKEVEEEKITAMLKAGMAAPSGMDRRPWEFVVVTDRAALDSMATGLALRQDVDTGAYGYRGLRGFHPFLLLVRGLFRRDAEYSAGSRSPRAGSRVDGGLSLRGSYRNRAEIYQYAGTDCSALYHSCRLSRWSAESER